MVGRKGGDAVRPPSESKPTAWHTSPAPRPACHTFSLSPISPRTTSEILSSMKVAPVSVAAALARRVFPVPVTSHRVASRHAT